MELTEQLKKKIAGKQNFKCKNKPNSNLRGLEDYKCPMWIINDGCFDAAGYDIDHIIEKYIGGTNEQSNLQALCLSCHGYKTRNGHNYNKLNINNSVNTKKQISNTNKPMLKQTEIDVQDNNEIKDEPKNVIIKIFGSGIDINDFTKQEIIGTTNNRYTFETIINIIRLIHFNPNHKEYHNVYGKSTKPNAMILTKHGLEHTDDAVYLIMDETSKFIDEILIKYPNIKDKDELSYISDFLSQKLYKRDNYYIEFEDSMKKIKSLIFDQKYMVIKTLHENGLTHCNGRKIYNQITKPD